MQKNQSDRPTGVSRQIGEILLSRGFWATVCIIIIIIIRPLSVLSCLCVCLSVALVYCGQTVGQIKMKLGKQVGLGPGHIVLGVDRAPLT